MWSIGNASLELWHPLSNHVIVHVVYRLRINAIFELKLEMGEQSWHSQLAHHFNKGLADADPAAAKEGRETVWVAPLALGSQEILTACIETFWNETIRLDPLLRVVVQTGHHDSNRVTFADFKLLTLDIL